jgi:Zn-dependent peptidase ImmA (M78 family)
VGDMRKPEIKDYRLYELEKIAKEVIDESIDYIKDYRVDIESLIIGRHGLIVDAFFELNKRHGKLAFMLKDSNRIFIDDWLLDDVKQEKRYRFTLAEEFAHYLIHKDVYGGCKDINERIKLESLFSGSELAYMESNAKALASAILMPKEIFEKRVEFYLTKFKSKESAERVGETAKYLSREFDVNPRAVIRRLKNLGYHTRADLPLDKFLY